MLTAFCMLAIVYHNLCGVGTVQKNYLLENRITNFISGISMEISLSDMVIFRVIEKLGLNQIIEKAWIQYIVTVGIVFLGTILFTTVMQKLIRLAEKKFIETRIQEN